MSDLEEALRLNLGCGSKKLEGYMNIDGNPKAKPNLLLDVTKGLPFKDNSVEEIRASHLLEHLEGEAFFNLMKEAYRVLRKGGVFIITVPHYRSPNAYCNPFHVRVFAEEVFLLFADTWYRKGAFLDAELPCFSKVKVRSVGGCFAFVPKMIPLASWKCAFAFLYDEIEAELVK